MEEKPNVSILLFDSDHPEFTRGFEVGKIWSQMLDQKDEFTATVSVRNAEMCIRLAEAANYLFVAEYLNEFYLVVAFKNNRRCHHH